MAVFRRHHAALAATLLAACADDDAPGLASGPPSDIPSPVVDAGSTQRLDASIFIPDAGAPATDATPAAPDSGQEPACDPVRQDCPADNDKCAVDLGVAPVCVAGAPQDRPRGQACEPGDCAVGLACLRPTETATRAVCEKVCNLATGVGCEYLGPDFECRGRIEGTAWGACQQLAPVCDAYSQRPCAEREACQPFLRRTGAWEFRCRAAGPGEAGDRCDGTNPACRRGLACVSEPRGTAACRQICIDNADCPSPTQCVGMVDEPPFLYCAQ